MRAGQFIQIPGILGHEGDVAVVPSRLDDGPKDPVPEPPRHGSHDEFVIATERRNAFGAGAVRLHRVDRIRGCTAHRLQSLRIDVGEADLQIRIRRQVTGDDGPDQPAPEYQYLRHSLDSYSCGAMRLTTVHTSIEGDSPNESPPPNRP